MSKLKVFLVDDHAIVREGIRSLVTAQPDMTIVGEAADGLAAVEAAGQLLPDVALLDLSLPGLSGIEVAERLKREHPQIKLLALTIHEGRTFLRQFMSAGGEGYVLKRALTEELVRAIRTVMAGGAYIDPILVGKGRNGSLKVLKRSQLSDREEEVLRLIAEGHTNKDIAGRLELSPKTVETYKTRSLEKLGLQSRADIVRYAVQQGWLLEA